MYHFKFVDFTDRVYGDLTVMQYAGLTEKNNILWLCSCSCGNTITVTTSQLHRKTSRVTNCGCLKKSRFEANYETIASATGELIKITELSNNQQKFARKYDLSAQNISNCLRGHRESYKGWKFNYKN